VSISAEKVESLSRGSEAKMGGKILQEQHTAPMSKFGDGAVRAGGVEPATSHAGGALPVAAKDDRAR